MPRAPRSLTGRKRCGATPWTRAAITPLVCGTSGAENSPQAQAHFEKAIERLTRRNANPYDGEPFYNLGLCLRYQADQPPGVSRHYH